MSIETFLGAISRPTSVTQENSVAEGRVEEITSRGMTFTIPGWDGGRHVFGPAPWPASRVQPADHGHSVTLSDGSSTTAASTQHDHAETIPTRGARCLVMFLGSGVESPWVIGWWPA